VPAGPLEELVSGSLLSRAEPTGEVHNGENARFVPSYSNQLLKPLTYSDLSGHEEVFVMQINIQTEMTKCLLTK